VSVRLEKLSDEQKRALLQHFLEHDPEARATMAKQAAKHRALRAQMARNDANVFIPFILRDEATGNPISQAPYHEELQNFIDDNDRAVVWGHVEMGKTQQVSVGRPLFELGKNPDLRVVVVQATATQATKIVRAVGEHIDKNVWLHMVFPHLKRGKDQPWNSQQLTVDRTQGIVQPSFQGIGAHGNILGARIDLLILDDILTMENTRTQGAREDIYQWVKSTLLGRLTPNARVIFLGNAWHPDDSMFRLSFEGWASRRFPVRDPVTQLTNWPERWPQSRIESKAKEFGPVEAARQLDCLARSEDAARFKKDWIGLCLQRGMGMELPYALTANDIPAGAFTFTGVDLGVKKGIHNDLTVLFSIMALPDGSIQVLQCESGKWSAPDIIDKIFESHVRYRSRVLVEDNGAQDFIRQFAKHLNKTVPIYPFNTRGSGKIGNKNHPQYGVEGIAAEMAGARWIIPCDDQGVPTPEIHAWIQEMLYYDPLGHTGDRLMASWVAREGGRRRFTHRVSGASPDNSLSVWDAERARLEDRQENGYPSSADRKRAAIGELWQDLTF
jgi:hypothetical protein